MGGKKGSKYLRRYLDPLGKFSNADLRQTVNGYSGLALLGCTLGHLLACRESWMGLIPLLFWASRSTKGQYIMVGGSLKNRHAQRGMPEAHALHLLLLMNFECTISVWHAFATAVCSQVYVTFPLVCPSCPPSSRAARSLFFQAGCLRPDVNDRHLVNQPSTQPTAPDPVRARQCFGRFAPLVFFLRFGCSLNFSLFREITVSTHSKHCFWRESKDQSSCLMISAEGAEAKRLALFAGCATSVSFIYLHSPHTDI